MMVPFTNASAKYLPYLDSLVVTVEQGGEEYDVLTAYYGLILGLYWMDEMEDAQHYEAGLKQFGEAHFPEVAAGSLLLLQSKREFLSGSDLPASLGHALDGIALLQASNDTNMAVQDIIALAYSEVGYQFEKSGAYDKALSYYIKSVELCLRNDLQSILLTVYSDLSYLYSSHFHDDSTALKFLEAALEIAVALEDLENQGVVTMNLGEFYVKRHDYVRGRRYIEQAILIQTALEDKTGLAHSYFSMASMEFERNDLEAAKANLASCQALSAAPCNWCADISYLEGEIAEAEGKLAQAETLFRASWMAAKEAGNGTQINDAVLKLAYLMRKQGREEVANDLFARYIAQKDSLDALWKVGEIAKLETSYKIAGILQEKEALHHDKEVLNMRLMQQRMVSLLVALLLVVTASGATIALIGHRKLNRSYKLLVEKTRRLEFRPKQAMAASPQQIMELSALASPAVPKAADVSEAPDAVEFSAQVEFNQVEHDLIDKVRIELEVTEVFTDNELTMAALAQKLETNTTYLSNVINNVYGKNFRTLINEYRVRKVIAAFESGEHKSLTIFAIAQKAGFKSKSAFNNAFSEYVGMTPTIYIKNM